MIIYNPTAGMHITEACKVAAKMALAKSDSVTLSFNGTTLVASPGEDAVDISARYDAATAKEAERFDRSDAGAEHRRQQGIAIQLAQQRTDTIYRDFSAMTPSVLMKWSQ